MRRETRELLRTILRVIVVLAVLGVGVQGTMALIASREPAASATPERPQPFVQVLQVQKTDHEVTVTATGTVRPAIESELVAEVAGRVLEVAPELAEGAFFAAGTILVRIDPRDFELAVVEAEAEVARAELQLALEKAEGESAVREWHTLQLEGQPPELVARVPQQRQADAALAAAEARLEARRRDLERCEVRAPYSGRVLTKSVDLGQYVGRGNPLARIYATHVAEVRLAVRDAALRDLDLGLPAESRVAAPPAAGSSDAGGAAVTVTADFAGALRTWHGQVARTEGQLDPRTRMINVLVRVADPYRVDGPDGAPLVVGTFVTATIHGRTLHDVVVLPRKALHGDDEVWVVDDTDQLRSRRVSVRRRADDMVVIDEGLQDPDRVCLTRLDVFSEGMAVRIAPSATDREAQQR